MHNYIHGVRRVWARGPEREIYKLYQNKKNPGIGIGGTQGSNFTLMISCIYINTHRTDI